MEIKDVNASQYETNFTVVWETSHALALTTSALKKCTPFRIDLVL